jgi:enamine deaminase RidA (YjgF/YER057c/UK114 family)
MRARDDPMLRTIVAASCAAALLTAGAAHAQVKRTGEATAPISQMVGVPKAYDTFYVAGATASQPGKPIPADMDTKAQSLVIFEKIKALLATEKMTMGDVVMMRVYLVADAAKGGKMDSPGMNEAFRQYFGTADQPNKPARVTIQVAALGSPTTLVEIEAQAARK